MSHCSGLQNSTFLEPVYQASDVETLAMLAVQHEWRGNIPYSLPHQTFGMPAMLPWP